MSLLSILRSWLFGGPLPEISPPADAAPHFVDKQDDVFVWPCGTWCHRYELADKGLPGDCEILRENTLSWRYFINDPELATSDLRANASK